MPTLTLTDTSLVARLTRGERIAGLLPAEVSVPYDAITEVAVEQEALLATRGMRAPGLGLPGVRKIGTWRGHGRRMLVVARRGQPALRVRLRDQRYDALLLGADDAAAIAEHLEARRGA